MFFFVVDKYSTNRKVHKVYAAADINIGTMWLDLFVSKQSSNTHTKKAYKSDAPTY